MGVVETETTCSMCVELDENLHPSIELPHERHADLRSLSVQLERVYVRTDAIAIYAELPNSA